MINWDDYKNFTKEEFTCKCGCGRADMKPAFMNRLQMLRDFASFSFPINSGFRCLDYDNSIDGAGVHPSGEAGDLGLSGKRALVIVSNAVRFGFIRIGVKQHGPHHKRFIHLDSLIDADHPSPWIWSYK